MQVKNEYTMRVPKDDIVASGHTFALLPAAPTYVLWFELMHRRGKTFSRPVHRTRGWIERFEADGTIESQGL